MNILKNKVTLKSLFFIGLTIGCISKAKTDISCTIKDVHDIVIDVKEKARMFFSKKRINKTFQQHIQDLDPILTKVNILLKKYKVDILLKKYLKKFPQTEIQTLCSQETLKKLLANKSVRNCNVILKKVDILLQKYIHIFSAKEQLIYNILTLANKKLTRMHQILSSKPKSANRLGRALIGVVKAKEIKKFKEMIHLLEPYLENDKKSSAALEDLIDTIESFKREKIVPASGLEKLKRLQARMRGQ